MRYIGSKVSSREAIYTLASKYITSGSFCDPFAGVGTISSYFKERGFNVYTSDLLTFAHYIQKSKLHFNQYPEFNTLFSFLKIDKHSEFLLYLNNLSNNEGWFINEFSLKRNFFLLDNAKKIDAIKTKIKEWSEKKLLTEDELAFLLASLIESIDKVANTAGTYYAYLKELSRKAIRKFEFKFIEPIKGKVTGNAYLTDALELIKKQHYNVIYLDPPYNERSYSRYYHLPEVISRQIEPELSGKSGIPNVELQKSNYNNKKSAIESFRELISNTKFDLLIFQYADNGLIEQDDIIETLSKYGNLQEHFIDCLGYSTKKEIRKDKHHIYMITK